MWAILSRRRGVVEKNEVDGVPAIAYSLAHDRNPMTYKVLERVEVRPIDRREKI